MEKKERTIEIRLKIKASIKDVWDAWTTKEGIESFFAPACNIDIRPGGKYEIYFNPESPEGERGGEKVSVMAVQPMKMFSFTWNSPPHLQEVRWQQTHVTLRFYEEEDCVIMTMRHDGWGTGGQWDESFDYFVKAWNDIVFPRLLSRFENGPVNWSLMKK